MIKNQDPTCIETLITLWKKERLGHFYLVRLPCQYHQAQDFGLRWTANFLAALKPLFPSERWGELVLPELNDENEGQMQCAPHPDVLLLAPSRERNYLRQDLDQFFQFLELRPGQLKRRLLIVLDAQKLGVIDQTSRLLKTLEEPSGDYCIIFLSSSDGNFQETVSSRALTLRPSQVERDPSRHLPLRPLFLPDLAAMASEWQQDASDDVKLQEKLSAAVEYLSAKMELHQLLELKWDGQDLIQLTLGLSRWLLGRPSLAVTPEQVQATAVLLQSLHNWRPYTNPILPQVTLVLNHFRRIMQHAAEAQSTTR